MSDPELVKDMGQAPTEPLLPIEKKLIGWSIAAGLMLLVILVLVNRSFE